MGGRVKGQRKYSTSIVRGEARGAIIQAATSLFGERGYAGTSVPDIAERAAVARATVFTAVGPKAVILKEVIDVALAGDDEPVPVSQRPWFVEMIDEPDPRRMLALHARNLTVMNLRVGDVYAAAEHGALIDPAVAELWASLQGQRLIGARVVADALSRKAQLRGNLDASGVADILWCAASPMAARPFVHDRGWPAARYEEWLRDFMVTTFLAAQTPEG
jgi:TetR/AcrR family transcriptional regulator, regulator of autoinduction and epiphytic fitness